MIQSQNDYNLLIHWLIIWSVEKLPNKTTVTSSNGPKICSLQSCLAKKSCKFFNFRSWNKMMFGTHSIFLHEKWLKWWTNYQNSCSFFCSSSNSHYKLGILEILWTHFKFIDTFYGPKITLWRLLKIQITFGWLYKVYWASQRHTVMYIKVARPNFFQWKSLKAAAILLCEGK